MPLIPKGSTVLVELDDSLLDEDSDALAQGTILALGAFVGLPELPTDLRVGESVLFPIGAAFVRYLGEDGSDVALVDEADILASIE